MPVSALMGGLLLSDLLLLLSNLLSHLVGYSLMQCYALGNIASTSYWLQRIVINCSVTDTVGCYV